MPEVKGPIARYNSIGRHEAAAIEKAGKSLCLSGYLGGALRSSGTWVLDLEREWAERFHIKHAVACNSATSGLLAAAFAVGLEHEDRFLVSPYTMSATVAAPMFTGAAPAFIDIEDQTFCMNLDAWFHGDFEAVITTSLFGHPSEAMRLAVELPRDCFLIEDNSQAPFAMEGGCYAGTFGDIGVFSLNVHKHLQCGEGGVCVTDDDELADKLRRFINHGEMAGGAIGLNLRLTEVSAAIALSQLQRADELIGGRIEQAEAILDAIGDIPGLRGPVTRDRCKHVYYAIPFLVESRYGVNRDMIKAALKVEGVPLARGYVKPLYHLPAFSKHARECLVAESCWQRLFLFENCAWSPTKEQIKQIGYAFRKVAEEMKL